MNHFTFEKAESSSVDYPRELQAKKLKGAVIDFLEEGIVTYKADFIKIFVGAEAVGYACIGTFEHYKDMVLEYYITDQYRSEAGAVLRELAGRFDCKGWFVNTHDCLSLPVMIELGLSYEIDGYQFEAGDFTHLPVKNNVAAALEVTEHEETQGVYQLIQQDGFYSGGGIETLKPRMDVEELHSLRVDGKLIGVGFIGVLARTPQYADIAMIIDRQERKKGWGVFLVKALIDKCTSLNITPTAVCGVKNKASRYTLQKAGFVVNGCILLAKF